MKLLVTGGAGFIGSNFIHYWLNKYQADSIVNLDVLTYAGNLANLEDLSDSSRYSFFKGDIADKEVVAEAMKGVDLVVHFAAESHVDRSIIDSSDFIHTNIEGTRVLLEEAKRLGGIRFHHVSTDEVFGALSLDGAKFNESTPYDPRSPYSASKAASDHLVRAYFHTHKLPITISNCSNNYGPYQYPEKLIPLFITNLIDGIAVPVYGEGKNVRDWIHVDDHNRGVDAIIHKGKIGETYCLGGNSEKNNLEITENILFLMEKGQEMIKHVPDRLGHDLRYAIDYTKASRELDWAPQINFSDGLKQTVEWYKTNEAWWRPLKK